MIPKVIHYCWFGGSQLPDLAIKCIESWKKYLPDYEIKQWDESNYDVNTIPYTAEAYAAKKYAFVSDYARFDILYRYGGIYFDTDVEVIKSFDDIVQSGAFMGFEKPEEKGAKKFAVNAGLGIGVAAGHPFYKTVLEMYKGLRFITPDNTLNTKSVVKYVTPILVKKGLICNNEKQTIEGITIYPWEFFCPIAYGSKKIDITPNTHSIHIFAATWVKKTLAVKIFGRNLASRIYRILKAVGIKK